MISPTNLLGFPSTALDAGHPASKEPIAPVRDIDPPMKLAENPRVAAACLSGGFVNTSLSVFSLYG